MWQQGDRSQDTYADMMRQLAEESFLVSRNKDHPEHYARTDYADERGLSSMLRQLGSPEHSHTRWGSSQGDKNFRWALADMLNDTGRRAQAELVGDPSQHVFMMSPRSGRVRPGRPDASLLERQLTNVHGALPLDQRMMAEFLTLGTRHEPQHWDLVPPRGREAPPEEIPPGHIRVSDWGAGHGIPLNQNLFLGDYPHWDTGDFLADLLRSRMGNPHRLDIHHDDWRYLLHQINTLRDTPHESEDIEHPLFRAIEDEPLVQLAESYAWGEAPVQYAAGGRLDYRDPETVANIMRRIQSDDDFATNPTSHMVLADAIEDAWGDNPWADQIRRQFGGAAPKENKHWQETNFWHFRHPDDFRPMGMHDALHVAWHPPFDAFLRWDAGTHNPATDDIHPPGWAVHAITGLPNSRFSFPNPHGLEQRGFGFGYTFEFPHTGALEDTPAALLTSLEDRGGRDMPLGDDDWSGLLRLMAEPSADVQGTRFWSDVENAQRARRWAPRELYAPRRYGRTDYSHETVANMLRQLLESQHDATRWGFQEGDRNFRMALADALRDAGREAEADLVESGRHVMVDQSGQVRPARFSHARHQQALMDLHDLTQRFGFDDFNPPHINTEDDDQPIPPGHARVGMGAPFFDWADVPYPQLGGYLAGLYGDSAALMGGMAGNDWTLVEPEAQEAYDETLDSLINAPFEEEDIQTPQHVPEPSWALGGRTQDVNLRDALYRPAARQR